MSKSGYLYYNSTGGLIQPNSDGVYVNATDCELSPWVGHQNMTMQILFYVVTFVIGLYIFRDFLFRKKQEGKADKREQSPENIIINSEEVKTDQQAFVAPTDSLMWIVIALVIGQVLNVIKNTWTVQALSLAELDAINDAGNYLNPLSDIFMLFEDGISVMLGHAVGAGNHAEAGLLFKWAAVSGIMCGAVGASITTAFSFVHAVFGLIARNQALTRPYWILSSWDWMFSFVNKSFSGLFYATNEMKWCSVVEVLPYVLNLTLFTVLMKTNIIGHTTIIGLCQIVASMACFALSVACFSRRKYRVYFEFAKQDLFTRKGLKICRKCIIEGSKLMIKDLVLTTQGSITMILASWIGMATQYQLQIFGTMVQLYGYVSGTQNGSLFSVLLAYGVRLQCSQDLGGGHYQKFTQFFRKAFLFSIVSGVIPFMVIVVFADSIPYYYSSNTLCQYAESEETIGTFNAVFDNIDIGVWISGAACLMGTIYSMLQSVLYATLDFNYMRNCTILCFVCVFLPSTLISYFVYESGMGLLVASNLARFGLMCLYFHRVFFVIMPDVESFVRGKNLDNDHDVLKQSLFQPNVECSSPP